MTAQRLLTSATGATTSQDIVVDNQTVAIYRKGTVGSGESIDLQVKDDAGSWVDVYDNNGDQVQLTNTIGSIRVIGPGTFRMPLLALSYTSQENELAL